MKLFRISLNMFQGILLLYDFEIEKKSSDTYIFEICWIIFFIKIHIAYFFLKVSKSPAE